MRILIIGANLTGLYLGYLFKLHNLKFEIYDKNIDIPFNLIRPNYINTINILNKLNISSKLVSGKQNLPSNFNISKYNLILNKIRNTYISKLPTNISSREFISSILTQNEFDYFLSCLPIVTKSFLDMEISTFIENSFSSLQILYPNKYVVTDKNLVDILKREVYPNLFLEQNVTAITYQPATMSYLLTINDTFYAADKIIITKDFSNIKININETINNLMSVLSPIYYTKIILKPELDSPQLITELPTSEIIPIKNQIEIKQFQTDQNDLANINPLSIRETKIETIYTTDKRIITDYWHKYGLLFTGIWNFPISIEDEFRNAKKIFNIINNSFFIDKLKHKHDNVVSIEENRKH